MNDVSQNPGSNHPHRERVCPICRGSGWEFVNVGSSGAFAFCSHCETAPVPIDGRTYVRPDIGGD